MPLMVHSYPMNWAELAGNALNRRTPAPLNSTLMPPSFHTSLSVAESSLCLKLGCWNVKEVHFTSSTLDVCS